MINKWLRENNIAAGLLTVLRLYYGFAFMTAGWGKISGGAFDASGFIKGAIANPVKLHEEVVYGGYVGFLENIALPNVGLFNVLVPWGEFLVGLGLILGCLTTAAAFFGAVMNLSFVMAGTVSHNPTDILMAVIIMAAGYNAGKFGLDRYVLPFLRKTFNKQGQGKAEKTATHSA